LNLEQLFRRLDSSRSDASVDDGYVPFREAPYRGHSLLIDAVLRNTPPGGRIFEGGVSSGYLARALVAEGRIVDGAELDAAMAEKAAAVCDRIWVGDLDRLDLDALAPAYDAFLFGDTLEHLVDPGALLRKLLPRLAPDGALVVSIPNIGNWTTRFGLLLGRFDYADRGILDRTHLRFFTLRTAKALLEDAGYRVVSTTAAVPAPGVTSPRLSELIHRIGNLRPQLFAYTFVMTAVPAR
jgi:2-polyprenyl-3-methyl-5-hydroxy-6-metoxy-1,4-benzoquinol methylase